MPWAACVAQHTKDLDVHRFGLGAGKYCPCSTFQSGVYLAQREESTGRGRWSRLAENQCRTQQKYEKDGELRDRLLQTMFHVYKSTAAWGLGRIGKARVECAMPISP